MEFISEFYRFLKVRKKYWLVPVLVMLILLGGLIVFSKGTVLAPFIYTLF